MSNDSFKQAYKDAKKELAKLKPQYEYLSNLIENFEKLFDLEGGKSRGVEAIEVRPGAFNDMTLKDAALKALSLKGSPATTRQLTEFIEGSGFKHGSKNFWNTLNTTLDRLHKVLKLISKGDSGWALNEQGKKYVEKMKSEKEDTLFKSASTNGS